MLFHYVAYVCDWDCKLLLFVILCSFNSLCYFVSLISHVHPAPSKEGSIPVV